MKLAFTAFTLAALAILFASHSAGATSDRRTSDIGFKSLCLISPSEGKALLPGFTVGDFIRKGKSSGRLKAVIESTAGGSHILRFLLVDQLSSKTTAVSLQFGEVDARPGCAGKRGAQLQGAAFNMKRADYGTAVAGATVVMYNVVQEEAEAYFASPEHVAAVEKDRANEQRNMEQDREGADEAIEAQRDACIQALARKNIIPSPEKVRRYCE